MARNDRNIEKTIRSTPLPVAYPATIYRAMAAIRSMDGDMDGMSARFTKAHDRHQERLRAIEAALFESIAKYGMPGEQRE